MDIGTGSAALHCTTTYLPCCYSGPLPGNHWYFPNGSRVERFKLYHTTELGLMDILGLLLEDLER